VGGFVHAADVAIVTSLIDENGERSIYRVDSSVFEHVDRARIALDNALSTVRAELDALTP